MTKTYRYTRPRDNWFWLTVAILNISLAIYILIEVLQVGTVKLKLLAFLFPFFVGLLGILFLKVYLIRKQYHQVDYDKVVTVDATKRQIIIKQSGLETEINSSDIREVEVFDSWNSNPIFSSLGYVKMYLLNGDIIKVTKFTATSSDLQPLITGHTVKYKTRLVNRIE